MVTVITWPNLAVQATAVAHCSFHALGDSPLLRLVVAQSPAAVPDLARWMSSACFLPGAACSFPRQMALESKRLFHPEVIRQ
jgi:hypothetical protein